MLLCLFLCYINRYKVQNLCKRIITGKTALRLRNLSYTAVVTLDRIGRVNKFSYLFGILEKGRKVRPIGAPALYRILVFIGKGVVSFSYEQPLGQFYSIYCCYRLLNLDVKNLKVGGSYVNSSPFMVFLLSYTFFIPSAIMSICE
jgi:hypothetical protein